MAEGTLTNNRFKEDGATETENNNDCINSIDNDTNKITIKKANVKDPEIFSCLLQPATSDPDYIGIRRWLLASKAESGFRRRLVSAIFLLNSVAFICGSVF